MPRKHTKHITSSFLIGLFVMVGAVIMIGAIIWLGANKFLKENIEYVTYFDGSVEGLETGSPVKYLGVPVGTIKSIRVAPDGMLIEVVMNLEREIEISDSLRIKSELAGIAGGKFLQMHFPGNPETLEMYPDLDFKPELPYIKSSPSGIDEIEIAARHVLENLRHLKVHEISNETVNFLQTSSKFFSSEELYDIIDNLKASSESLEKILFDADSTRFIDNIDIASANLLHTTQDLERFATSLNTEIYNLKLEDRVDGAFKSFDTTMAEARTVIKRLGYRSELVMVGLNEALEELKVTNRYLRKSLRAISDNPSQVFFSEPPKEEK